MLVVYNKISKNFIKNTKLFFTFFFGLFLLSSLPLFFIFNDYSYLQLQSNETSQLIATRSIFNGNLPYIEHFEPRGPLLFYIYSISFFFKNFLLGFHILNFFIIFLSCIASYKVSYSLFDKNSALFAFFFSALILSQGYTAEHLIFFFLYLFIYFSVCKINENKIIYPILSGLFMSFAVLIRFNISILAFLGFVFFLTQSKKKLIYSVAYIISGLIPLIIIMFFYYIKEDGLKIFWNSTFIYHLNLPHGRPFYIGIYQLIETLSSLTWISLFVLSISCFFFQKNYKKEIIYLIIFFIVSILSLLLARKFNSHYFLVSAPFLIVLGSSIINIRVLKSEKATILLFLICFVPLLINNFYSKVKSYYRPDNFPFFLSQLLKNHIKSDAKVFSSINGVYLYMNKKNYLRFVDSSLFDRDYNYESVYGKKITFLDEFKNVLINQPDFLIIDKDFKNNYFYADFEKMIQNKYKKYEFYEEGKIQNLRKNYREQIKKIEVYKII